MCLRMNEMKTVGIRIRWVKYLLLFVFLCMAGVNTWLFYSLSIALTKENGPDTMLWVMSFLILAIVLLLFVLTVLNFIKKHDAILIQDDKVVIRNYKVKTIDFKDIKNIQYRLSVGGSGGPHGIGFGTYKSGKIIFTLSDGKTISVDEIKEAKSTCAELRNIVLKEEK